MRRRALLELRVRVRVRVGPNPNPNPNSSKAKELLAQYDKDGDGKMELGEFVPLVLALRAVNLDLADEEAGLRAAFDKFDANRSGKLDHSPNPNPNPNPNP